jgi:low temperature requirement protein LtrA
VTDRSVTVWRPMLPRDSTEAHRASTPLELLFDLCFVVAVAQVSNELHHYLARGDVASALPSYVAVFFAIWWAWMNFTWFASAYDTDDVAYRVATLVQITGVLVLAAGVPRAFEHHDFTVVAAGYTVMRLALISQWLRAAMAHEDGPGRTTALRYAVGLATSQALWLGWLLLPTSWQMWVFPVLALYDVAIPLVAERPRATNWHPRHIAERYGLFTLIVLGESILAATLAVQSALDEHQGGASLFLVAIGGLLTVFAMWWLYFAKPAHEFLTASNRASFLWGYGHYFVFASAAGVGAGVAVNVDLVTHHAEGITPSVAAATVTIPVAVFLLVLWVLQVRPHRVGRLHDVLYPVFALLVLGVTPFGARTAVLLVGLLLVGLVVVAAVTARQPGRAVGRSR